MAPFIGTAGEHSGRPPPYPPTAATANGCMAVPAHDRIELRDAQWVAAAFAAMCGLLAYILWASANHEEAQGGVAIPSEPSVYALVVSPALDQTELAEIEPGEVTMPPPDSSAKTQEVLARQLAREMDAIETRHALLTRHRIAISKPLLEDDPEPWPPLELQGELERLTTRGAQDLPSSFVDPVTNR